MAYRLSKQISALVTLISPVLVISASAQTNQVNQQNEQLNLDKGIAAGVETIRVLRAEEKATFNDYVTEVFELRNAEAIEILPLILDTVRAEGGSASIVKQEFYTPGSSAEAGLSNVDVSYLQVVAPEFQIDSIRRLVAVLDKPGVRSESGVRYNHIRLAHRNAQEVADIIQNTVLSPVGNVSVDKLTNTVYIEDGVSDAERALMTAAFYDVPPPQVEIHVNIIELEGNDDKILGLEWDAWKETLTGGYIFEYAENYSPSSNAFVGGNAIVALGGDGLARFINYMADNGTADVVSRTTLMATNCDTASFSNMTPLPNYRYELDNVGLGTLAQVRYDEEIINTAVLAAAGNGDPIAGVTNIFGHLNGTNADFFRLREYFEHHEGIALTVTPTIGTDSITLDVDALLNTLVDNTSQETPVVASRDMQSNVNLEFGETLKLGSFDRKAEVIDERGIPVLKDIPYLGYIFKREVTVRRDKKVVIFLTPELRTNGEYAAARLDDRTVITDTAQPSGAEFLGRDLGILSADDQSAYEASEESLRNKSEELMNGFEDRDQP